MARSLPMCSGLVLQNNIHVYARLEKSFASESGVKLRHECVEALDSNNFEQKCHNPAGRGTHLGWTINNTWSSIKRDIKSGRVSSLLRVLGIKIRRVGRVGCCLEPKSLS